MPTMMGFYDALLSIALTAASTLLRGRSVLDSEVAVEKDQGKYEEKEDGNADANRYYCSVRKVATGL